MLQYNILDLYPDCVLPDCPDKATVHQHIFDKQLQIQNSTAKYLYCQGGVGSSKSVAFAAKSVWQCITIPENVGVVSRKDYKLLYKSSWLDFKKTIKRLVDRGKLCAYTNGDMSLEEQRLWYNKKMFSDKKQGDYTTCTFPNSSVAYAMQGKNWSEGLGASYGWFWIDDAMESFEEMFIGDDTSAGLLSRLRLPYVHYREGVYDADNRQHGALHGMVSTNPPPVGHYLHKLFGTKPGLYKIGEDTVEWIMTATYENPTMGADYAKGLMAIQAKMGRSSNTARRVIFGESVPAYGGVKVFPEFKHEKHITEVVYDSRIPIVRGWDFGFHHPAVVFSHLYKCNYGTNHYVSLSEVSDQFSLNIWDFYKAVKEHTDTLYSDCCLILDGGDRAGYRKSDSNRDRRGPIRILQDEYKLSFSFRFLDLEPSLEYMRSLLDPKKPCRCGQEIIQISNRCQVLIGALEGGYKYTKGRDGKVSDRPVEDRYFADVACGWRYGAENFVKWGIPWDYQGYTTQQPANNQRTKRHEPWAWMDLTDKEMAEVLTR
jgi:hypothetical protein